MTPGDAGAPALFQLSGVRQVREGRTTLDGVDLAIPARQVTAIVGPSGAGKTSLLRLLDRLDDPVAGTIAFDGRPLTSYPVRVLRQRVGFVFQRPTMFPGTVADNLRAGLEFVPDRDGAGASRAALESALAQVELDPAYLDREAATLSGGEQQRVSIGRALLVQPAALLLDEPTSALDPEIAERLMATVVRLSRERALGVVMVTHRLSEARTASSHMVMLEAGRVVETGATDALVRHAARERTRAYLLAGG